MLWTGNPNSGTRGSVAQNGQLGAHLQIGTFPAWPRCMLKRSVFGGGVTLALGVLCSLAFSAKAANFCVGPSATGTGSGADWNNLKAWSNTPSRGDTWYLVAGTYSGKTFSTAASASTLITITKATASNYGNVTTTGWNSSMAGQAVFTSQITFASSYWVFDGATSGALWSTNASDYGFNVSLSLVADTSANVCVFIDTGSTRLSNITIAHVYAYAAAVDCEKYFVDSNNAGQGADYITVQYCYAEGWENAVKMDANEATVQTGWLIQYNVFNRTWSTTAYHGEDVNSAYSDAHLVTVRYNWMEGTDPDSVATGIIVVLNPPSPTVGEFQYGDFYVYGNVFKDKWCGDGLIGGIHHPMTGVCYNNTFVNCQCGNRSQNWNYAHIIVNDDQIGPDSVNLINNLVADMYGDAGGTGTMVNNSFYNIEGTAEAGTSPQMLSSNPFANLPSDNLTLAYNTLPGTTLGNTNIAGTMSTYDVDAYGNMRGGNGQAWSRGAFQYVTSGTNPVILVAPSSLAFGSILTNTTGQSNLSVKNVGAGTLAGTASVALPFSIVSGGSYSLGANQSQSLTVLYSPTAAGTNSETITFTGGGGATATVIGVATTSVSKAQLPSAPQNLRVVARE
jgi:hypothetical protein